MIPTIHNFLHSDFVILFLFVGFTIEYISLCYQVYKIARQVYLKHIKKYFKN